MVGAGVGLAAMAKPDYVPSQFAPGNYPNRVDISQYLGAGTYPGHSYRLVHRRDGDATDRWQTRYGWRWVCTSGRCGTNAMLSENYDFGYIDGFDDGAFAGAVFGHREGWTDGQASVIQIMDANGFVVFDGDFTPASYVKETFSDKAGMRIGGVGLAAVGAIIALAWPDSPARATWISATCLAAGGSGRPSGSDPSAGAALGAAPAPVTCRWR